MTKEEAIKKDNHKRSVDVNGLKISIGAFTEQISKGVPPETIPNHSNRDFEERGYFYQKMPNHLKEDYEDDIIFISEIWYGRKTIHVDCVDSVKLYDGSIQNVTINSRNVRSNLSHKLKVSGKYIPAYFMGKKYLVQIYKDRTYSELHIKVAEMIINLNGGTESLGVKVFNTHQNTDYSMDFFKLNNYTHSFMTKVTASTYIAIDHRDAFSSNWQKDEIVKMQTDKFKSKKQIANFLLDCMYNKHERIERIYSFLYDRKHGAFRNGKNNRSYRRHTGSKVRKIIKRINVETMKKMVNKVYVMVDRNTGLYKIGRSTNPLKRERTLQSEKPTIELLFHSEEPKHSETELHDVFKSKRVRGEWFKLSIKDLGYIKNYFGEYQELLAS